MIRPAALLPIFAVAAAVTWATARTLVVLAPRRKRADRPPLDARERSRLDVPRLGGIALLAGAIAASLVVVALELLDGDVASAERIERMALIVTGCAVLVTAGVVDDLVSLSPWWKLGAQATCATLVAMGGVRLDVVDLGLGAPIELGVFAVPVTALALMTITNAVNLVDGIDGLAAGIAAAGFAGVMAAALLHGDMGVAAVGAAGVAVLLGFLPFNVGGARLHLGDCGSTLTGMVLGMAAITAARGPGDVVLAPAAVLFVGYPLAEIVLTVGRRTLAGIPLFRGDRQHLHHRLLQRLDDERAAAGVLVCVAGTFAATGVVASRLGHGPASAWLATAGFLGFVVVAGWLAGYFGRASALASNGVATADGDAPG